MKNIKDFKDIHKGERGIIACNGPSLNDIPMSKIRGETVFGLNRGYLKEDLPITYLVVMVKKVAEQWGDEILSVPCDTLFTTLLEGDHVCPVKQRAGDRFSTDISIFASRGHTVTYYTMQIAYYMGFSEVYLIGLDHSYDYSNTKRDESHHRAVISTGDDPNHFHPDYFGEGANWLPYSPDMVEKNYKKATKAYQDDGRILMNISTQTKLPKSVIPRGNFEDIL
jgi:hypothetical protein